MKTTKEEKAAINALNKLSKKWPKTLWVFADGYGLRIMKCNDEGERVMYPFGGGKGGGVNPDYMVESIDIPNDGGDW